MVPRTAPSLGGVVTMLLALAGIAASAAGCEPSVRGGGEPDPPAATVSSPHASGSAAAGSSASASTAEPDAGADAAPASVELAAGLVLPAPTAVGPVPDPPIELKSGGKNAVRSEAGLVSSAIPQATRIGVTVLEQGGNAIDAAVAVAYALAVTHPQAGALGGGGFMLIRLQDGSTHAIDYREMCPAQADEQTNKRMLSRGAHGYGSAPVPGVVAGLNLARERFGSRPLAELLAPAIALAKDGHRFSQRPSQVLAWYWDRVQRDPTFKAIFGRGDKPLGAGGRLRQPSLATTLEAIAEHGSAGFYEGEVATKIERAMAKGGGHVARDDLAKYRAVVRPPLRFRYRGFEIHTMPPPSMGGIALASMMLALEHVEAHAAEPRSGLAIHLFAEAARRAYLDRRSVAADPAFVDPKVVGLRLARLLDPRYYAERAPAIDPEKATATAQLTPLADAMPAVAESPETTHFSVVDRHGNAVSCTTTLSAAFGAHVIPPGTGVILSNALGGFSPSGINRIEPGKRMASSMTPTVVLQDGKLVALLGSPGGDTIPATVAQVLRNLVDWQMTIDEAVQHGRVYQQLSPDKLRIEKARKPSAAARRALERSGHVLLEYILQGHANSILVDRGSGVAFGIADPRQGGLALGPQ